jgi:hypothetical protein
MMRRLALPPFFLQVAAATCRTVPVFAKRAVFRITALSKFVSAEIRPRRSRRKEGFSDPPVSFDSPLLAHGFRLMLRLSAGIIAPSPRSTAGAGLGYWLASIRHKGPAEMVMA